MVAIDDIALAMVINAHSKLNENIVISLLVSYTQLVIEIFFVLPRRPASVWLT